MAVLGVKTPAVRSLARDVELAVRGQWSVADAVAFCDRLSQRRYHEEKVVGLLVLGRFHRQFPRTLYRTAKGWITDGRFRNWAGIDTLCPAVLTPLVERYPDVGRRIAGWANARLLWLRRAAAVTFVPRARHGENLDTAYRIATALRAEREDLVQKAAGWLLREAGKTDAARLERFLLELGPDLPRTTVRYAIERFPEARRRRLLRMTRG
jgi:3-methyladenine DNA glycosylase AlkD